MKLTMQLTIRRTHLMALMWNNCSKVSKPLWRKRNMVSRPRDQVNITHRMLMLQSMVMTRRRRRVC